MDIGPVPEHVSRMVRQRQNPVRAVGVSGVDGVVFEDQVDLQVGVRLPPDGLQEAEELLVPMPGHVLMNWRSNST